MLLSSEMAYYNLFDAHPALTKSMAPVFQIDGNFGGTSGMTEMIVQSTPSGQVRLLAALPSAWSSGHLTGIRLRGGWTVNVWWEGGRLVKASFQARVAGIRQIETGGESTELKLEVGESGQLDGRLQRL